ncbi:NAD(P)/FAD-dependent oxidoreductase [Aequorivita vladivostokensis]|uniref:NADH:ubiquinone reductase (non-electrogenic) n=1 Tax=Aequorivita vladivostokensis TaxID=171194 RepID=A0ABR5DJJ6_9FLAO|nr:NAD(P)/FAD-dependent oxidoreductase [Aequorivita vladivostokensis]KJJ38947.1 NADH dehydrogenase [Aequorivita vladivostokensis]MAB58880.1 NAD(P)/FAD-dependent oxidoreductase [Aequorivita sp.]MBF30760.1 NAD(P)/FAD-dependent oxidoreductase [Aequorivita sp.]|tara:strand:- start:127273 stop:128547 length:1275 start_codon:yes stop_codon:yes gene_type:complete
MNIPETSVPRIVVIGGGFAGISFIKKLQKEKVQIVLFDRHNYHTFQPLLYQVSTAGLEPDSIAYPLRKIFRKNVDFHFRMAEVETIQAENNTIHTSIGSLHYDFLVIATGTRTNFFGNDSIAENSMPMKTVPQALNIRSLMLQNIEKADMTPDARERKRLLNFVIAGAGPTGVELAGALAEFRKGILENDYPELEEEEMNVHLIEGLDRVLPPMSKEASAKAQKFLENLGVQLHLETFISDYDGKTVTTKDGQKFETATFIWAAGVTGALINGIDGKALVEKANRYRVDRYNKVEGFDNIYALGDIALMETEEYPKGHPQVAQPAIQQGKHLGKNFRKMLKGEKMEPFEYFDKGTMATVGRNKAVVDIRKLHFGGAIAWFLWMFVHLWFLVGFRNRVVTFFNWTYSYINYDRAARLIIRPFKKN